MSTQKTPENLPRIKSFFKYNKQFYFEPKLSYNFDTKKWQLSYLDGIECFHFGYNQSFWEAGTLQEVIEKTLEYFEKTNPEDYYQFR